MNQSMRIAVLTGLAEKDEVRRLLSILDMQGHIETRFPTSIHIDDEAARELLRDCIGCIVRPTGCRRLKIQDLDLARKPFVVCTLSVGDDHLVNLKGLNDVEIVNSNGGNAHGAAEMTLQLANELIRPTHTNAQMMRLGMYHYKNLYINNQDPTRIFDKVWLMVGSGKQVAKLIPRLIAYGPKEIHIWNRKNSVAKFGDCLKGCIAGSVHTELGSSPDLMASLQGPFGTNINVKGWSGRPELIQALGLADIISIHIPATKPSSEDPGTMGMFNATLLKEVKANAILVNVARGSIIDEDAVISNLESGHLRGYAADVLNDDVESPPFSIENVARSPLWTRYYVERDIKFNDPSSSLNIILTPHMGGRTDIDYRSTSIDAFNTFLDRVKHHYGNFDADIT